MKLTQNLSAKAHVVGFAAIAVIFAAFIIFVWLAYK